jgi:hypothetical protein
MSKRRYSNLADVVQEHCVDEMYAAVRATFWDVTLRALVDSALQARSVHDRVQLTQKYGYIKDEFKQCVATHVFFLFILFFKPSAPRVILLSIPVPCSELIFPTSMRQRRLCSFLLLLVVRA